VINVSWDDAKQYVAWLSRTSGQAYRLPTEAEWEYAARAGSLGSYSFGNDEAELEQHAWFRDNSGQKTQPVAKRYANSFGLHDMHGNVWEWVEEPLHNNYNGAPSDGSAWLEGGIEGSRILRGGSWADVPDNLRSAGRGRGATGYRVNHVGFRVARTLRP
jgi:formylglycine-generating enzyme required for sulfatase activity